MLARSDGEKGQAPMRHPQGRGHRDGIRHEEAQCSNAAQHVRHDYLAERSRRLDFHALRPQAVLMTSSMLHKWKVKLANYSEYRELYNHVRFELRDVKMALDLREDIWEIGGYNIASADQGLYEAIEMRNRTFSCIHDFITTTSASQVAQGASEVTHSPVG